ncbi:hypothetical protein [Leptolyngbya iicbica]|uniref:Uncharacterized protein n=2 Tax=Cyanophyceae TaxID=3028117 RepID=A0A4Q7E9C7_9CYAN|nr:hypothetical protein [Leptolyngbya sp. LK]RZM79222.1 hypothetical protein DYY88_10735 [Leptolyngbya sp. LK]
MSDISPLEGIELIDCAKANADNDVVIVAERCGYGQDVTAFQTALQQACTDIGINVEAIADLITPQQRVMTQGGLSISPDTASNL